MHEPVLGLSGAVAEVAFEHWPYPRLIAHRVAATVPRTDACSGALRGREGGSESSRGTEGLHGQLHLHRNGRRHVHTGQSVAEVID